MAQVAEMIYEIETDTQAVVEYTNMISAILRRSEMTEQAAKTCLMWLQDNLGLLVKTKCTRSLNGDC